MQQFVPRHVHVRLSLGKLLYIDKTYVAAIMNHPPNHVSRRAMSCRSAVGLHVIPPNTTMN